ncbi:MAG: CDP-glycerol glycerophosphotransferase family protein [Lachnospiraceae bacterium]|nr:CDP-glycerol glycerophosphotransferase family protein [Lachnospiraceae bacterium]
MGFWKERKKRKAEKRQERLEKGGFWWKYYRFVDRFLGRLCYARKCMACPIDPNLIVFEAFQGKYYACSPKAMFEEMLNDPAYAGYRFVWSFTNCRKHMYLTRNKRVTLVKRGSEKYYEVMASAKYRITNSTNPLTVPVRKGQTYIQTWHGTPLKRLGLDIERDGNAAQSLKEIHALYRREATQFDYLLSPSAYTTEKLATAFGLSEEEREKKIVETGYPRNVSLFTYTPETAAELKEFYGIPEGKKVILYAPTFREADYRYGKGFTYQIALDVEHLRERFGETACVLMRTHYLANAQFDYDAYEGFLIKVSGVEDVNRLYIISDLLITDYSSVMFDFSVLRRPMIFYMYDQEQYRGELRDFYIEPDILPGPIVTTQEDLETEIEKALFTPFVCDGRYEAFRKKFTYLDDADAAKRAVAAMIAPQARALKEPARLTRYKKRMKRIAEYRRLKKKIENGILKQKRYPQYLKRPLKEKAILLESQHGRAMDGNIFALLAELAKGTEYEEYTLYLTAAQGESGTYKKRLCALGMGKVKVLRRASLRYFKILATAKYLINDNTFIYNFIKREGQVYLNTWHGTPLKTLGRKIKSEAHAIGNTQKNFLAADYLLYPNEFTMEHMVEDYMLDNLGTGEIWLAGYPRNAVFFDKENGERVRRRYGLEGKKVYAFLPTWRGVIGQVSGNAQVQQLTEYLTELDAELPENYLLYVKLHTVSNAELSVEEFSHIRLFPEDCETYEFLNATDGLITDYSSVFFDYAVSRKKIILFTYDEEEYEAARGFYFPLSCLPFPQAKTAEELLHHMKAEKSYDDTEFLKTYCAYERADVAASICRKLLFGGEENIKSLPIPDNGKKNVVIFGGALNENGITTSLFNLLSQIDREKYNYTVLYKMEDMKKHPKQLERIPEEVHTLGFSNGISIGFLDSVLYKIWTKRGIIPYRVMEPILDRMAERDTARIFTGCRVDKLIHFSGYSNDLTTIFRGLSCNKTIYAHNDMEKEVKERNLIRSEVLTRAYQEYDSVAVVTEDIKYIAERIAEKLPYRTEKKAYVTVAKNVIDYRRILELSGQELMLDATTQINVSFERLQEILAQDAVKFVNIGRFSPEKGHERLLDAFEKIHAQYPDTYLIIIGGRGVLYEETLKKAQELKSYDHIVIILYMSNPYALLKRCDYFVFSSFYEGFGLVLAEADIVGVRCVSTNIDGPRLFMQKYGGTLVENSAQGVYDAMKLCLDGKVTNLLSVDYEVYNKEAVAEFEKIAAME